MTRRRPRIGDAQGCQGEVDDDHANGDGGVSGIAPGRLVFSRNETDGQEQHTGDARSEKDADHLPQADVTPHEAGDPKRREDRVLEGDDVGQQEEELLRHLQGRLAVEPNVEGEDEGDRKDPQVDGHLQGTEGEALHGISSVGCVGSVVRSRGATRDGT